VFPYTLYLGESFGGGAEYLHGVRVLTREHGVALGGPPCKVEDLPLMNKPGLGCVRLYLDGKQFNYKSECARTLTPAPFRV
jgi:hypothetical protein